MKTAAGASLLLAAAGASMDGGHSGRWTLHAASGQ